MEQLLCQNLITSLAESWGRKIFNAETMKNCEPAYDFEKTKDFLQSFCIGRNGAVAAVHKQSQKMIGYILFNEIDPAVYEMGWIFNRSYWRQGYAYEACKAVIDYAFCELNARKVFAETIDGVKSAGLMQKLGMKSEGVQRSQTKDNDGNWSDLYLYSLLGDEWKRWEATTHADSKNTNPLPLF